MDIEGFPAEFRQDDGSCSSVLSQGCIRAVEVRTIQEYTSPVNNNPCHCPNLEKIEACSGQEVRILRSGGACLAMVFNTTATSNWPNKKHGFRHYGWPPHDRGNRTAYNQTGSLVWPFVVMWGPSENATRNETGHLEPIPDTAAKLTCLRAKEATAGSVVPGWSGGTRAGVDVQFPVLASSLVMLMGLIEL
ncbi:hypothetical protein B0T16DRAFT_455912 [Cercophora newfieldiana]|uniref:Uncharacterized protein n=1 Tax=Cercophora newfieldiana TaxID=92897 RepID=A0AA39Y9C8_9PEZI|nr:hypothetical protein B0T16DRAFT_455912 [Cercophora newfieldiana]